MQKKKLKINILNRRLCVCVCEDESVKKCKCQSTHKNNFYLSLLSGTYKKFKKFIDKMKG